MLERSGYIGYTVYWMLPSGPVIEEVLTWRVAPRHIRYNGILYTLRKGELNEYMATAKEE